MRDRARKPLASALSALVALGGWPAAAQPHLAPMAAAARPPLMPPREAARALESWHIFRDKAGQRDKLRRFLIEKDGRPTLLGWVVYRRLERWARQGLDEEFSQELGAMLPDFAQLRESGAFTDARAAKLARALRAQEEKLGRIDKAAEGADTLEGEFQRSELYAAVIANLSPPAVSADEKTFAVEDRGGQDVLSAKDGKVLYRTDSRGVTTWSRSLSDLQRRMGLPATGQYSAALINQEVEPSRQLCAVMRQKLDDDEVLTMSNLLGESARFGGERLKSDPRLRAEVIAQAKRTKFFHQDRERSIYDDVEERLAERREDLRRAEDGLRKLESQARLIEDRMRKTGLADLQPIQDLDVMSSYVRRWAMATEADWQMFHIRQLREALDPDSPDAESIRQAIGSLPMDQASRSLYLQHGRDMNDELEAARQKVERTLLLLRAGESPAGLHSAVYSIMATRRVISRLQMRQVLYAQIPLTAAAADQAVIDGPVLSMGTLVHGGARLTRGAYGFMARGYARNMDAVRSCRAQLATVTRLIAAGREDEAIHSMSLMRGDSMHALGGLSGVPGAQAALDGLQDCQDHLHDVMVPNKWLDSLGNLATWSAEVALTGPLAGKWVGKAGLGLSKWGEADLAPLSQAGNLASRAASLAGRGVAVSTRFGARIAGSVLQDASNGLQALEGDSAKREAGAWRAPILRGLNPLRRFGLRWGTAFKRQLGFSATMGAFSSVLTAYSESKALVLGDREPFKGGWFWGNWEAVKEGFWGGIWSTSDLANNNREWWWLLMPYFNSALPAKAFKGIPLVGRAAEAVASGGPLHWVREFFTDTNLAVTGAAGKAIEAKARDGWLLGAAKGLVQHADNYGKYYLFDRATSGIYRWHVDNTGPHSRILWVGPEWGKWGGWAEDPDYERRVKAYNMADQKQRQLPLPLWVLLPGASHVTPEMQAAAAGDAARAASDFIQAGVPEEGYGDVGTVKSRLKKDRGTLLDQALSFDWLRLKFWKPREEHPGTFTVSSESNRMLLRRILNPALSVLDLLALARDPEDGGFEDNTSLAAFSLPSGENALAHPEREAARKVVTSADVRSVASALVTERLAENPEQAFDLLEDPRTTPEQRRDIKSALIAGRKEISKKASPEVRRRLTELARPYLRHERFRNAAGELFVKAARRLRKDSPGLDLFRDRMMHEVWRWLDARTPQEENRVANKEGLLQDIHALAERMTRENKLSARERAVVDEMFNYIQVIDEHGFNAFTKERPGDAEDEWLIHDALGNPMKGWKPKQLAAFLDGLTLFATGSRAEGVPRFFEQLPTGGGKTLLKFLGFLPLVRASARAMGRGVLSLTTQASLDAQDRANFRAYRITDTDVTFALYDELAGKMAQAKMSGRGLNRYFVIGDEIDGALLQAARSVGRPTGTITRWAPAHGLIRQVEDSLSAHLGLAEGAGGKKGRNRAASAMQADFEQEARLRRLVGGDAAGRVRAQAPQDPHYGRVSTNEAAGVLTFLYRNARAIVAAVREGRLNDARALLAERRGRAAGALLDRDAEAILVAVREGRIDDARRLLAERRGRALAFAEEPNRAYEAYRKMKDEAGVFVHGEGGVGGVRKGQDDATGQYNQAITNRFHRYQDGEGGLRGLAATARLIGHVLFGGFFTRGREAPEWTRDAAGAVRWHAANLLRFVIESAGMPDHEREHIAGRLWRSLLKPGGESFVRTELARMFMGHVDDGAGFHYDERTGRVFVDMNGSWHPTMDNELLRFYQLEHNADLIMPYEHAASVTTEHALSADPAMPVLVLSGSVGEGPGEVLKKTMGFTISGRGSEFPPLRGYVVVTPEQARKGLQAPGISKELHDRLEGLADAPAPTTLRIAEQPGDEFDQWLRKPGNSRTAYNVHVSAHENKSVIYDQLDGELNQRTPHQLITVVVPDRQSLDQVERHLLDRNGGNLRQDQIAKVFSDVEYLRNHVPEANVREQQNLHGLNDGRVRVLLIQADYARGGDWNFKGDKKTFRGYTSHRMRILGAQNMAQQDLLQSMGRISVNRILDGVIPDFEILLDMDAVQPLEAFDRMLHGKRQPKDEKSLFGELAEDAKTAGYGSSWTGINRLINDYKAQAGDAAETVVDWYENRLWETLHDQRQSEVGARKLSRSGSGAQPAVDRGHELYRGLDSVARQSRARN